MSANVNPTGEELLKEWQSASVLDPEFNFVALKLDN